MNYNEPKIDLVICFIKKKICLSGWKELFKKFHSDFQFVDYFSSSRFDRLIFIVSLLELPRIFTKAFSLLLYVLIDTFFFFNVDLFFVTRVFVFLLFVFGYVLNVARDISKTFTINSWGWCIAILEYRSVFSDSFINFIVSPVFWTVSAVTDSLKCRVNPMYFPFQLSVVCTINESLFVVLFLRL